jgi:hypothetical protein
MNVECEVSARMTNPIPAEAADMELVRRAQAGGSDAFVALATRCEQRVHSLAFSAGGKP